MVDGSARISRSRHFNGHEAFGKGWDGKSIFCPRRLLEPHWLFAFKKAVYFNIISEERAIPISILLKREEEDFSAHVNQLI